MKKLKETVKGLWSDESAQGATEYILLLAIVVGIAMAFGPKVKKMLSDKMGEIEGAVQGVRAGE
jgi:Flp pilus assembly pilin Flp